MSIDLDQERKWHRKTSEEKLRRAVFAAMSESRGISISPTKIGRHAGLAKSLVYKHFESVELLVKEAIQKHFHFPPAQEIASGHLGSEEASNSYAIACRNISKVLRVKPELAAAIVWSIGNQSDQAREVIRTCRNFCESVALEFGSDVYWKDALFGFLLAEAGDQLSKLKKEPIKDK